MDYIPGKIHEKLGNEMVFSMLNDFSICICKKRFDETSLVDDSEFIVLDLKIDNIIKVRLFKPKSIWGADKKLMDYWQQVDLYIGGS